MAQAGGLDRAGVLAGQAEAAARCRSPTQGGRRHRRRPGWRRRWRQAGDLDRRWGGGPGRIADPYWRAVAPAGLGAVAQAGGLDRAGVLAGQAEAAARSITDPDLQAMALAGLVGAVAQVGDLDRAGVLAGQAEAVAQVDHRPVPAGGGAGRAGWGGGAGR